MLCFLGLLPQPTVEVPPLFRSVLFQVVHFPSYGSPHNWWRPVCKNKVCELKKRKTGREKTEGRTALCLMYK